MRIITMTLPNNAGPRFGINAIGMSYAQKRVPEITSAANGNTPNSRLTAR